MALFPKTLIKWKEPAEFRDKISAARRKQRPKWFLPALVIFVCAFIWLRVSTESFKNPQVISSDRIAALIGGTVIVAIAFVYGISFLEKKLPSWVTVTDKSISRGKHNLPFKQILSYGWLNEADYRVLQIRIRNGSMRIYGFSNLDTLEKIEQAFSSHNIPAEKNSPSLQAILDESISKTFYVQFTCILLLWLIGFSVLAFGGKVLYEESKHFDQQRAEQMLEWDKFHAEIRALDLPAEEKAALLKFKTKPILFSKKVRQVFLTAFPVLIFLNLIAGTLLIFKFFEPKLRN